MQKIPFINSGRTTSHLGFGCSGLMGPPNEQERFALLETAYAQGIRHFDVARYYGMGQAEGVLGRFIAQKGGRDQVTITTKFGLNPPSLGSGSGGRLLINLARRIASIHPAVKASLASRASAGVRRSCFDVESASNSLHTSLRELGTDYIDLFLLHEANIDDTHSEGLMKFLEDAKQAGKILAYGLGSDFSLVPPIVAENTSVSRILQFSNGLQQWNLRQLPAAHAHYVNTHGGLKVLPLLKIALENATSELKASWENIGSTENSTLAGLLLGLGMQDNPQGVVLFSSTKPANIASSIAQALRHTDLSASDWKLVESTAESALASRGAE